MKIYYKFFVILIFLSLTAFAGGINSFHFNNKQCNAIREEINACEGENPSLDCYHLILNLANVFNDYKKCQKVEGFKDIYKFILDNEKILSGNFYSNRQHFKSSKESHLRKEYYFAVETLRKYLKECDVHNGKARALILKKVEPVKKVAKVEPVKKVAKVEPVKKVAKVEPVKKVVKVIAVKKKDKAVVKDKIVKDISCNENEFISTNETGKKTCEVITNKDKCIGEHVIWSSYTDKNPDGECNVVKIKKMETTKSQFFENKKPLPAASAPQINGYVAPVKEIY